MATLYELTGAFNAAAEELDNEKDLQLVLDTLESIDLAIEDKADGYAKMMANNKANIDALKNEENRLASKRKALENQNNRMKESLTQAMIEIGKTKFKTPLFSFNIQANKETVTVTNLNEIPSIFLKAQEPKPDKTGILAAYKSGKFVPGVEITKSESLRIR